MPILVEYKNGKFVPLEKVKLEKQTKKLRLKILPSLIELKGVLSNIKMSSVELQHEGLKYFEKDVSDRH